MAKKIGLWGQLPRFLGLLRGAWRGWQLLRSGKAIVSGKWGRRAAEQLQKLLDSEDASDQHQLLEQLLQRNQFLEQALQATQRRLQWCLLLASLALLFALAALLVLLFGA